MIRFDKGYSLAVMIIMTTFILAVLAAAYRVTTRSYIYSREEYYYKLAQEAGESGTAAANACLDINNWKQTWGHVAGAAGLYLTPSSDCKGQDGKIPTNKYVMSEGSIRTIFTVGDLNFHDDHHSDVSAIGKTQLVDSGGMVLREYTVSVKKLITRPGLVATKSSSGTYRTCGILSNSIWCWGRNRYGQLGNGRSVGHNPGNPAKAALSVDSDIPVKVVKQTGVLYGKRIDDLFTAQYHSCALAEGKVYCWGYNGTGQLGNGRSGDEEHSNVPIEVKGALAGKTVTSIGGSYNTSCAIAGGKIYCWGEGYHGVTGTGDKTKVRPWPTLVRAGVSGGLPNNYTATALATSGTRSMNMCAIANGFAYCWGQNNVGQIGNNTSASPATQPVYSPMRVSGLTNVTNISQDGYLAQSGEPDRFTHVCAAANGEAYCWGNGRAGQLGMAHIGYIDKKSTPVKVDRPAGLSPSDKVKKVEVGIWHSCMLMNSGRVFCWGTNAYGHLGANLAPGALPNNRSVKPIEILVGPGGIPAGQRIIDLAAGANRGCAVVENGHSYCWGLNDAGQIGDGTHIDARAPTESLFLRPTQNRYIY